MYKDHSDSIWKYNMQISEMTTTTVGIKCYLQTKQTTGALNMITYLILFFSFVYIYLINYF